MTLKSTLLAASALTLAAQANAQFTVISQAIEDLNHLASTTGQNRNEMILNNTGSNTGRFGAARYDTDILGGAAGAPDFWDSSLFTLTGATLTLVEEAGRNSNNGTLSGRVGAYFMNTAQNSDWTVASLNSVDNGDAGPDSGTPGDGWYGNNNARPGNVGGGATGANNVDSRSNGGGGLPTFWDGMSWVNHTFDSGNSAETAVIDLTSGGASLAQIQSILADWVAGNNAGLGLGGEFGNQTFWQSVSADGGVSVGSTINGDATYSGVSTDDGTAVGGLGNNGPGTGTSYLTLTFVAVPEPSAFALLGIGMASLLIFRRRS